eukprot:scaffold22106_cov115-Skeletonema_dohrnii-CCMP3373.AAC.2
MLLTQRCMMGLLDGVWNLSNMFCLEEDGRQRTELLHESYIYRIFRILGFDGGESSDFRILGFL